MYLEIKELHKSFGSGDTHCEVLRGISCGIEKGNIGVLLGPSGSGKSTLLNIIGGIETADKGSISMLLVYLLSKMIIEKNAQSISMLKILGYSRREISSVYNSATAIVVGVSLIVTIPISAVVMKWLYDYFMAQMSGWVTFYIAPWIWFAMPALGAAVYFIVHLIQTKRLERVPMAQALKMADM